MGQDFEEKKRRLSDALERGVGQLHVDARRPGVLVPERFAHDFHLVLNFSHHFAVDDLALSDWGVRQSLSFGGVRTKVGIPWSAIYAVSALATKEFWLFPRDMPPEMLEGAVERQTEVTAGAAPSGGDGASGAASVLREVLRPVPTAPEAPAADDGATPLPPPPAIAPSAAHDARAEGEGAPATGEGPRPQRRSHLRLVK